jgi:NAD(P)-dependent dehydrogenase (short-subunit alcohol dehydrogenase family)
MSDTSWDLQDRSVVITGASSGMGAETARFLGAHGAKVTLQGRDVDRLAAVAKDVEAAGGKAKVVAIDLEDLDHVTSLIHDATTAFGPIHGLVLNASLFDPRPLADTTLDSLQRQWNTNVAAHFLLAQAAVDHMPSGSAIVFVSSTTGLAGFPGCSAYSATKGATEALARALAIELAPQGIRVNSIAPGFFITPMTAPIFEANPGYQESLVEQTPIGRLGLPEEIGATIAFLLSGFAPYINGSTVVVDGGWTTR